MVNKTPPKSYKLQTTSQTKNNVRKTGNLEPKKKKALAVRERDLEATGEEVKGGKRAGVVPLETSHSHSVCPSTSNNPSKTLSFLLLLLLSSLLLFDQDNTFLQSLQKPTTNIHQTSPPSKENCQLCVFGGSG